MQEKSSIIELPGLALTRFDVASANVTVRTSKTDDIEHPQLILKGEEDAFTYDFQDSLLDLTEQASDSNLIQVSGSRGASIAAIGKNISIRSFPGNSITINGVKYMGNDTLPIAQPRKVILVLPKKYEVSHDITTKFGDVDATRIEARILKVKTMSGDIAVRQARLSGIFALQTMSGNISYDEVYSTQDPIAMTMSGDISVKAGNAIRWDLSTLSGDITVKNTQGIVAARTVSGHKRIK